MGESTGDDSTSDDSARSPLRPADGRTNPHNPSSIIHHQFFWHAGCCFSAGTDCVQGSPNARAGVRQASKKEGPGYVEFRGRHRAAGSRDQGGRTPPEDDCQQHRQHRDARLPAARRQVRGVAGQGDESRRRWTPRTIEPEIFQPQNTPVRSNGNDVNLEIEIGEMLKNSLRQTAYVRLLRKKFSQMETAMGVGG